MLSYEYIQFLNSKVLEYLPASRIKNGNKYNFRCPLCGDSKKSATKKRGWWYMNTASYYCFNCGTGLSGIKFLEAISGASYEDIRKEYTRLFLKSGLNPSLSADYDIQSKVPDIFSLQPLVKPEWKHQLTEKAVEYLESRRVLEAPFLNDTLYSYISKNGEEYILIPWKLNGIEAYYQINDFQKLHPLKYIFPKGTKKTIAGLDNIDVSFPYIIVFEGYYDSIFVKNGVCVGTKAITDYQLQLIKQRYPHHQIVISFDNDQAGIASTIHLLQQDKDYKYFKWFNKNTKEKDINDYIKSKNDVDIFSDPKIVEHMIIDKLKMKMQLLQDGLWKTETQQSLDIRTEKNSKKATSLSQMLRRFSAA